MIIFILTILVKLVVALILLAILVFFLLFLFSVSTDFFWTHQILWGRSHWFFDRWGVGTLGHYTFSFAEYPKLAECSVLLRFAKYAPFRLINLVKSNPQFIPDIVNSLLTTYKDDPDGLVAIISNYEHHRGDGIFRDPYRKSDIENYLVSIRKPQPPEILGKTPRIDCHFQARYGMICYATYRHH